MDAAGLLRDCRRRSGLSLRQLAERAGTSHATLAAYEQGRTVPRSDTLVRILDAAGFALSTRLVRRCRDGIHGPGTRGRELAEVLEVAEQFPARHTPDLRYPVFRARR